MARFVLRKRDPLPQRVRPQEITKEVIESLRDCGCDPIVELARYALGDVVSLGLMTQEELEAEAEYDIDGNALAPSGRDRALKLIPPKMRMEASKELAQYEYAKIKPSERGSPSDVEGIVFYMPDNQRDPEIQKSVVRINDQEIRDA